MIKGETKSEFKFEISEEQLDNMELLDILAEIDGGRVALFPEAARLLLGETQKKELYNHVRTEKGNVPIDTFMNELKEILEVMGNPGKN